MRVFISLLLRFLGLFGAFVLTVVLTRKAGIDEAGRFFWASNIVLGLSCLTRLGFDITLLKLSAPAWTERRKSQIKRVYIRAALASGFFSLIVAAIGIIVALLYGRIIFPDENYRIVFMLGMLMLVPATMLFPTAGVLKGIRKPEYAAFLERAGQPIIAVILIVVLGLFIQITAATALIASALACGLLALLGALVINKETKCESVERVQGDQLELKGSYSIIIICIAGFCLNWWCGIALAWYAPANEVAIFNVAQRVSFAFVTIHAAIVSVYAPKLLQHYIDGEIKKMEKLLIYSNRIIFFVALPAIIPIMIAPDLVMSIFGEEYKSGGYILIWLVIGQVINICTGTLALMLTLTGHESIMRNICVSASLLVAVLTPVVISSNGPLGASLLNMFGFCISSVMSYYVIRNKIGIKRFI